MRGKKLNNNGFETKQHIVLAGTCDLLVTLKDRGRSTTRETTTRTPPKYYYNRVRFAPSAHAKRQMPTESAKLYLFFFFFTILNVLANRVLKKQSSVVTDR